MNTSLKTTFCINFNLVSGTVICLQDYIRDHIGEGKYTGMILLDIQKAFDSVNHKILFKELEVLGVKSKRSGSNHI